MAQIAFYILAAIVLGLTFLAVTARHPVHAIVYLAGSFFLMGIIFYLLNSPLVAVFEVILYAGAILMLLLFVVMMFDLAHPDRMVPEKKDVMPAVMLGLVTAAASIFLVLRQEPAPPPEGQVTILGFAALLFTKYGLAVEIVSLQLLLALVGALYLGRRNQKK